jgi:hypothetical protein
MAHARTEKSKRRRDQKREKGILKPNRVDGLPPNDNLRKHPDEAYGDTQISRRGRTLETD